MNINSYKIEFYTCPAHIPFHFALHPWVVIWENDTFERYEVIHKKYKNKEHFGFVYKNFYNKPDIGIKKHPYSNEHWI